METKNKQIFDSLDDTHFKSASKAENEFNIFKDLYRRTLGYDSFSDGFVVLQKGHQPLALSDELPIANILKKEGFGVILLDETGLGKQADALIDGQIFDFKNLRNTTNYFQRIKKNCQNVVKKNCTNVVMLIDKDFSDEDLIIQLRRLAGSPQIKGIEKIWFVVKSQLLRFELADFK